MKLPQGWRTLEELAGDQREAEPPREWSDEPSCGQLRNTASVSRWQGVVGEKQRLVFI